MELGSLLQRSRWLVVRQFLLIGAGLAILVADANSQTCAPIPAGLVHWYRGENNALDSVGGNHGALSNGVAFTAGTVGRAFTLDGVDDVIVIPHSPSLNPTQALSIEAWVFPTADSGGADVVAMIVSKENATTTAYELGRRNSSACGSGTDIPNGHLAFYLEGVTGLPNDCSAWVDGNAFLPLNTWSHIALTFDGSSVKVYKNGALTRQLAVAGALPVSDGPVRIGGRDNPSFAHWTGSIDEVSIYGRALSSNEIQAIFMAGSEGKCVPVCTPPPAGLVSWWRAENSVLDFFGTNNGSLVSTVTFTNGLVGSSFFLGGSGYVQVPSSTSLSITDAMTLEGWVFQTSFSLGGTIASKYATGNGRSSWYLEMTGNQINFHVDGDGNPFNGVEREVRTPIGSVSTGVWTHVVATVVASNQDMKIYLNGVESPTTVAVGGTITRIASTAEPLRIASNFSGGQNASTLRFRGMIDDFSVYNRALTSNEITGLFAASSAGKCLSCTPPAPNIVGWWRAENNGEDSINNNTASLGGGTLFTNGLAGRAFSFDGIDDVAFVADAAFGEVTNNFTMEMWAFPTEGRGAVTETVSSQTGIGTSQRYAVFPAHGDNSFGSGHAGAGISVGTNGVTVVEHAAFYIPSPLVFDTPLFGWNHIAIVYSNNQASLYVNGVFAHTGLASPRIVHPSAQMGGGVYGYFAGLMDEYAVYSRALSADEVRAIFVAGSAGKCVTGPIAPLAPEVVSDGPRLQACYARLQPAEETVHALYARWAELEAKQG